MILFYLKIKFLIMCVYRREVCAHECSAHRGQRALDPLVLKSQMTVGHLMMLGPELRSSKSNTCS